MSEYLTFPVIILKDGIKDIKLVTNDAMFYIYLVDLIIV